MVVLEYAKSFKMSKLLLPRAEFEAACESAACMHHMQLLEGFDGGFSGRARRRGAAAGAQGRARGKGRAQRARVESWHVKHGRRRRRDAHTKGLRRRWCSWRPGECDSSM